MTLSRLQFIRRLGMGLLAAPLAVRAGLRGAPVLRGRPPCPACGGTTVSTSSTTGCCAHERRRAGFYDPRCGVNWASPTDQDVTHYHLYGLTPGQSYDVRDGSLSS